MGSTLTGTLAYGFDLGGGDDCWNLKGAEKWEPWIPSWEDEAAAAIIRGEVRDEVYSYHEAIEDRLRANDVDGVDVVRAGMVASESSGFAIVVWQASATGSNVLSLHLPDLIERRKIERWDNALGQALKVLDITPWQPHPMWLLTQSYG